MAESRVISWSFSCEAQTVFGQEVRVVGSTKELGHWNPALAPALKTDTSAYPKWFGIVECRACWTEFKYVIFDSRSGQAFWEEGLNRILNFTLDGHVKTTTGQTSRFGVADNTSGPSVEVEVNGTKMSRSCSKEGLTEHTVPLPWMPTVELHIVHFDIFCAETQVGDTLVLVGSCAELGEWNPMNGLKLCTSPEAFPRWRGTAHLKSNDIEFKLAIINQHSAKWEATENRHLRCPAGEHGPWQACCTWNSNRCQLRPLITIDAASTGKKSIKGKKDDDEPPVRAPSAEAYQGLCDQELMPRLDGVVLPDAPKPASSEEGSDLYLWGGAHTVKKPHGNNEDAFFFDVHAIGIADGVGCFSKLEKFGVNAAKYAAELMQFACLALQPEGRASARDMGHKVAERAAEAVAEAESRAEAFGGSTIAVLCQHNSHIGVANLGDSGFALLRRGMNGMSIVLKSQEQQHFFNCPYQLTHLPKVPRSPSSAL